MGAHDLVPSDEEWLREVVLVAIELMVNIMECAVVVKQHVQGVAREHEPAVVVNGFHGAEGEEEHGGQGGHAGDEGGETPADHVQDEALEGVGVEGGIRVGHHKVVVLGVDVLVQELVRVQVAVDKVLIRVHDRHRKEELAQAHCKCRFWHNPTVLNQLQYTEFSMENESSISFNHKSSRKDSKIKIYRE